MAKHPCIDRLVQDHKLSPERAKEIITEVLQLKKEAEALGLSFKQHFLDDITARRQDMIMRRRAHLSSIEKFQEFKAAAPTQVKEFINSKGEFDHFEYMSSLFSTSSKVKTRIKSPLEQVVSRYYKMQEMPLIEASVKYPEQMKLLAKGDDQATRDFYMHIYDPDYKSNMKGVADAFMEAQKINLKLKQDRGLMIYELENRAGKLKHDPDAIREVGFDRWKEDSKRFINRDTWKIMDEDTGELVVMNDDQLDTALKNVYDKIISREVVPIESDILKNTIGDFKLKKAERHRKFVFKDADSEFQYRKLYGPKQTVLENFASEFQKDASYLAAFENFGAFPEATINQISKMAVQEAEKLGYKLKQPSQIKNKILGWIGEKETEENLTYRHMARVKRMYQESIGLKTAPGDRAAAMFFSGLRGFIEARSLGTSVVTTVTDFGFSKKLFETLGADGSEFGMITQMMNTAKGMTDKNGKEAALHLGLFTDGLIRDVTANRFTGEIVGDAGASRLHPTNLRRHILNATFLPQQARSTRQNLARMYGIHLAKNADKTLDQLPSGLAAHMKSHGINEMEWEFIKKHGMVQTKVFGVETKFAAPDIIFETPDDIIRSFIGEKASDKAVNKFRHDVDIKLSSAMSEIAELGSPTPNARTRSLMNIFDQSTFAGQLVSTALQFKSFPISVYNTMKFIAKHGEHVGKSGARMYGETAAITTGLGALVLFAKDILANRDPFYRWKDIGSPMGAVGALASSAIQGGSFGILGDWVGSPFQGRNIMKDALGPAIGLGVDTFDSIGNAAQEFKNISSLADVPYVIDDAFKHMSQLASKNVPSIPVPFLMQVSKGYIMQPFAETLMTIKYPEYMGRRQVRKYNRIDRGEQANSITNMLGL